MITEMMVDASLEVAEEEEPTKRQIKDKILEEIRPSVHDIQIYQDRPNTFISVKVIYKGYTAETFAFSKVSRPDKWDAEYGINLAIEKALHKAARCFRDDPRPPSPLVECD